jgi:hypothetical protein
VIEKKNIGINMTSLIESVVETSKIFLHTSSSRLVDDTENIHARDGTSILGSLTLRIVEVSGDSDDSLLDGLSELGFSNFLHLDEDHRRNFCTSKIFISILY